jgi:hypothetical protein
LRAFFGRRGRPHLLPLFVLAGFATLTGPASAEKSQPPILCPLDFLSGQFVPGGSLTLISWAADPVRGAPVARMEVWLDRSIRGDVRLAGYRPDVASAFGRADYFLSGWIATVSLRDVEPGSHRVEVFAYRGLGDGVSCGLRDFTVRPFPRPLEPPPWRIGLTLLARVAAFVGWLAFVGWGPLRLAGGGRVVRIAPAVGLSLLAVATEAGAVAGLRPLGPALVLTALSGILLAISTRSHPIRVRRPHRYGAAVAAIVLIFAVVGSIPLIRHGPGSVLGSINDAAWECSVADSIARYGWTVPTDVHGLLAAVPAVWRAADFRAGVPYPLALLAQVFRVRAHEVHSVLTIAVGILVLCAVATLAGYLFRRLGWLRVLAVGLVAVNSILFAQLYYQHTGILIATLLYLSFVYCLIALVVGHPLASILPAGLLLAGAWTLYPETMVLWSVTAAVVVVLSGSFPAGKRKVVRLALALVLAAAVNPIGLARTVRETNALRHASALATAERRTAFGDTHYFPSPLVIAGIRPYRIDWRAPSGPLERPVGWLTAGLLLSTGLIGLSRANAREWRLLLVLLVPVSLWLLMNRMWKFPYGYSKGLPHVVPLASLALVILVARKAAPRSGRWARPLVIATLSLLAAVSISGSVDVVGQAFRGIPGYDSAFRSLPELVKGIDRSAVIVVSEPLDFRREWMAYFLGEYRVVRTREEATSPTPAPGGAIYELFDRRSEQPVPRSNVVRSNPFFALVRS